MATAGTDVSGKSGIVFNIQRYSLHDGPGIRTVVFLKGCLLRCEWCSNPESQVLRPQLAVNPDKCLGAAACRHCRGACPQGALRTGPDGNIHRDAARCDDCLLCSGCCPSRALTVYGEEMRVAEVLRRVEADEVFYARSGGGLTLSGGEPLFQDEFALALLQEARRRRIDTSLETCGYAPWPVLAAAARWLKSVSYDLKCMDSRRHLQATGVPNEPILDNLVRLRAGFPELPVTVRMPVIPGFNDSENEVAAIAAFIRQMPRTRFELLAYHRLGMPKYGYLGRVYPLQDAGAISRRRMMELKAVAQRILAHGAPSRATAGGGRTRSKEERESGR